MGHLIFKTFRIFVTLPTTSELFQYFEVQTIKLSWHEPFCCNSRLLRVEGMQFNCNGKFPQGRCREKHHVYMAPATHVNVFANRLFHCLVALFAAREKVQENNQPFLFQSFQSNAILNVAI